MKIHIRTQGRGFSLLLPTRLLFSKAILKLGLHMGKRYSPAVPQLPPAAIDALCREIHRIKKTGGSWELVNIQSAQGEEIQIFL